MDNPAVLIWRPIDQMKSLFLVPLAVAVTFGTVSAQTKSSKTTPKPSSAPTRLRFIVAPTGNEARYRVREQLAGFDLPNDAVGATTEISGRIVVEPNGKVVKDSSKIIVQLTGLKSDKSRRDGYLQRRTLETDKFPNVELVPLTFEGLSAPIPAGTTKTFSLIGDLTVHGVTRPTTWQVTARAEGKDVVGTAVTAFTFKDVGLDQPRVPAVLSVADTIKLEYDFRFAADTSR